MAIIDIKITDTYRRWHAGLRDRVGAGLIDVRLDRLRHGHFGDVARVGEGIYELRVHYGPGYRIYFEKRGNTIILLLCGGDKSTQARDIKMAKRLATDWSI